MKFLVDECLSIANLDSIADELTDGAFVVITDQRIRLRSLALR